MDRVDIINHALQLAEHTGVSSSVQNQDHISKTFDLYYEDILTKRNWLWAHDIFDSSNLVLTEDGANLGYKYKYTFDTLSKVNKVLDLNRNDLANQAHLFRSKEEALDFGYTLPDDPILNSGSKEFVFIDNILHTDCENIENLLVQIEITPVNLPSPVKILLATELGAVFAKTIARKREVAKELKEEAKELWVNATREENKVPNNQHIRGVYEWLKEYYSQTRLNRNYT